MYMYVYLALTFHFHFLCLKLCVYRAFSRTPFPPPSRRSPRDCGEQVACQNALKSMRNVTGSSPPCTRAWSDAKACSFSPKPWKGFLATAPTQHECRTSRGAPFYLSFQLHASIPIQREHELGFACSPAIQIFLARDPKK